MNNETEHANGCNRSGRRNRCRCLIDYAKGDTMEVLPEAHGRSSKQREPPGNLHERNYGEWKRRSVRFRSDNTSSSISRDTPLTASPSLL